MSSSPNPQGHDPGPAVRQFARTALVVEPLTGLAIWAVGWSVTYLGGRAAALAGTGAALVVAAVAAVVIRTRRPFTAARALLLTAILVLIGAVGVATVDDTYDAQLPPILVVLCAGPAAWVVLWPERAATGLRRFLVAAALVVPLGYMSFAVGLYVTPFVLLTALGAWLVTRAFPPRGWPARNGAVAAGVTVSVICGVAAGWFTHAGSLLWFLLPAFAAPTVALILLAVSPRRLPRVPLALVAVALVAALAYDVLLVLRSIDTDADYGARVAAGAAFGHLGVTWGAAMPTRRDRSRGTPSDDPVAAPHAGVPAS